MLVSHRGLSFRPCLFLLTIYDRASFNEQFSWGYNEIRGGLYNGTEYITNFGDNRSLHQILVRLLTGLRKIILAQFCKECKEFVVCFPTESELPFPEKMSILGLCIPRV